MLDTITTPPAAVRHTLPDHARIVLVDWMLGNACNFACSYCPPALHDGSQAWQTTAAVKDFLARLRAHYVDLLGRQVWLQFTGGEPTMYPGFVEVIDAAHAAGFRVSVISNGSRTRRFWEQAVRRLDAVILTYHDESVDHTAFLITCEAVTAAGLPLHINVTVHPDRFDAVLGCVEDVRRRCPDASITLKPLRIDFGSRLYDYTAAQLDRLTKGIPGGRPAAATAPRGTMTMVMPDGARHQRRPNDFILRDENRWRGFSCDAGLESLRVTGSGEVRRAVCGAGGLLGRLGEEFDLPFRPIVCDRDRCSCVADILITKRRV